MNTDNSIYSKLSIYGQLELNFYNLKRGRGSKIRKILLRKIKRGHK